MANTQKISKKATTEQCNKHIVSGSASPKILSCSHEKQGWCLYAKTCKHQLKNDEDDWGNVGCEIVL